MTYGSRNDARLAKKIAAVTNQGGAKLLLEEMNRNQATSVEKIIAAGVAQGNAGIPAYWPEPCVISQ